MLPTETKGRTLLIVDDEYFLAGEVTRGVQAIGVTVMGPVPGILEAVKLLSERPAPDGAFLDVRLKDETVYPLADLLDERGIPYVFTTGYDRSVVPEAFSGVPLFNKPVDVPAAVRSLFADLEGGNPGAFDAA